MQKIKKKIWIRDQYITRSIATEYQKLVKTVRLEIPSQADGSDTSPCETSKV